jgi:hypothetical protein
MYLNDGEEEEALSQIADSKSMMHNARLDRLI